MAKLRFLLNFLLIASLEVLVFAQTSLPACGQTCINNELASASGLGCSASDGACLCANVNFGYGIRDCAQQACDAADATATLQYAAAYCAQFSSSSSASVAAASTSSTRTIASTATQAASTSLTPVPITSTPSTTSASASLRTSTNGSSSSPLSTTSMISTSSSSLSTASPANATTTPSSSSQSLSTGAKARIGIGAVIGFLILALLIYIALLLRKKGEDKNPTPDSETAGKVEVENVEARRKAELETTANIAEMGGPLSEDEKTELKNRRRAAELQGSSPVVPGVISERAELEARRRGEVFEMS